MSTYKTVITTNQEHVLEIVAPTPLETLRLKYEILKDGKDLVFGFADEPPTTIKFDDIASVEYIYY